MPGKAFDPAILQAKRFGFDLDELGPGVYGRLYHVGEAVIIPTVASNDPGKGNVARWLDTLPRDKPVIFLTVINTKLRGMLLRRGFRHTRLHHPLIDGFDGYARLPGMAEEE